MFIKALNLQLNPMFGAAAMSLSSFCVVTNALRLNFFKLHDSSKDHGSRYAPSRYAPSRYAPSKYAPSSYAPDKFSLNKNAPGSVDSGRIDSAEIEPDRSAPIGSEPVESIENLAISPVESERMANRAVEAKTFAANQKEKETKTMEKTLQIEGMMCGHCEAHVKKALEGLEAVTQANVSHETGTAVVTLTTEISDDVLTQTVADQGYKVTEIR